VEARESKEWQRFWPFVCFFWLRESFFHIRLYFSQIQKPFFSFSLTAVLSARIGPKSVMNNCKAKRLIGLLEHGTWKAFLAFPLSSLLLKVVFWL